jgi:hypothetical protein
MLNPSPNGTWVDCVLEHRTRLGKRSNRKRRYQFESLESRTLLTYTFVYGGPDGPETVNETGGNDSFTVVNGGFGLLEWSSDDGATFSTQWGTSPSDTLNASTKVSLSINLGADNSAIIDGTSATASSSASEVLARWNVNAFGGNTADSLTINDSASTLGPGTYEFNVSADLRMLTGPSGDIALNLGKAAFGGGVTIQGSNSANTFAVINTYASASIGEPVTILGGSGDDTAVIYRTTALAPATVQLGGGSNTVIMAEVDILANIGAPVFVTDPTTLNIYDSGDTTHATATLDDRSGNGATPFEVTGLGNAPIEFGAGVTAVNLYGGTDASGGVTFDIKNTQPGTTTTIIGGRNQNTYNLSNASEPGGLSNLPGPVVIVGGGAGDSVDLDDSDNTANDNYTVTDTTVTRTGAFGGLSGSGISSLTVNGGSGDNLFTVDGTLANDLNGNALTTLSTGTGNNTVNIPAFGVAGGTTLVIDNGPGTNTLNFDAGGEAPTITAGVSSGEILITIPDGGTVDAINEPQTNITNAEPLTITPGPPDTINGVEGYPLANPIVATFTLPITARLPAPAVGVPASDFTASIDWGDDTPLTDGSITEDTTDPIQYSITGTHTFLGVGTYSVANTVTFLGGALATLVNGVSVSITYAQAGPTVGNSATANVIAAALTVSALPIFGTEGEIIAAAPIATFVDTAGFAPLADYSASIAITSASGFSLSFAAASITQSDTRGQFIVNAPAFTLPEEGTYQVVVSVTDSAGRTPVTFSGTSLAVIADAPLTAGPSVLLAVNTGFALPAATIAGTFTDANPLAPINDFTDTINWGDGSPDSLGTITQPGGIGTSFVVNGTHTYTKPSNLLSPPGYAITIAVTDEGGSTVTLTGRVDVTDLPVTGATSPGFTAIEGMNSGMVLLATFTDPNKLATNSDVTAFIPIGGWGDGTPTAPGGPLVIQQIGVTPSTSPVPGQPIFDVFGGHQYGELTSTSPSLPLAYAIDVATLGGVTTTMTSPFGGGVTVLDAPLTAQTGNTIAGSAGISTDTVTIGSFLDANSGATSTNFTALPGSTEIFWGDGTTTALTAANFTATNSASGLVFSMHAAHTYAAAGQYVITINVTDDGGQTTAIFSTASIATFHTSSSAFAPNDAGFVSLGTGVEPTAILSSHMAAIHRRTTSHKPKPSRTLSHPAQRARAHDAALKAIVAETRLRRLHE